MTNNFRNGDLPGPDYKCSECGLTGHRMWRMGGSSCVELLCAVCAENDQRESIARYAGHHQAHDPTIGDLVPARRDPEDAGWWGHTSGEITWWYALPQYEDPARELERVRIERDRFLRDSEYYAGRYLDSIRASQVTR